MYILWKLIWVILWSRKKIVSRGHDLLIRGHNLLIRGHDLLICGHNLLIRGHDLPICGHDILRYLNVEMYMLVNRGHELVARNHG